MKSMIVHDYSLHSRRRVVKFIWEIRVKTTRNNMRGPYRHAEVGISAKVAAGWITEDFYNKKLVGYRAEQTNIQIKQKELQEVDKDYYSKGIYLLNLANKAPAIFKSSEPEVKRQLIKVVLQNPTINGVNLCADYRKPFSIFAEGSSRHNWLPGQVKR
jgi:hypothetical protein